MSLNFKAIQKQYPDAIKCTVSLIKGADPLTEKSLKFLCGGGKILYLSKGARSQTVVCSKQAEAEEAEKVQKTAGTL